ncbi:MAG: hypothetical protein HY779_01990 [Rubrobacteridae bacterium]|nr:hypothetical protein [Rubrobacteridae bacterium]
MKKTIKNDALEWWAEKTKSGVHVVLFSEIPGQRQREILIKEKFLYPVIKGIWILKRPEDDIEDIFTLLYWQVILKVFARYSHWSLRGQSALSVLNGDHSAKKHLLVRVPTKTKSIAERVLVDAGKLSDNTQVRSFIAGSQFNKRLIEAVYASSPKPYIFTRLIRMAKEAGRFDLALDLEKIIETHTHYRVVGREKIEVLASPKPEAISPPWIVRQKLELGDFEKALLKQFSARIKNLEKKPIDELITQAKEHKKYDTYHSTTLEVRISLIATNVSLIASSIGAIATPSTS